MTFEELQQELAAAKIRPAYHFRGEEEFLIAEGARAVLEALFPHGGLAFGLVELDPESQAADCKTALCTPSFFGTRRAIRVRQAGKLPAEVLAVLAEGVRALPAGTCLLIEGELDKKRNTSKALAAAAAGVDCPVLRSGPAAAWARSRAQSAGFSLAPEAAQLLVDSVGCGLRQIDTELRKAAAYLGGENRVLQAAELAPLLGREREDDVFQLVEAAASGRVEDALRILADLRALGEPEARLMVLLTRQVRQIMLAGYLQKQGKRSAEIAAALHLPPFIADKLLRQTARFSMRRCQALLERMLLADVRSKTGEREAGVELELVVLAMAGVG